MNTIRFKHRLAGGGGAGSPTGSAQSGEVAINFDVTSGAPELWGYDTAWKRLNPSVTVTTQSINLGATGTIGAAYTTWVGTPGNALSGNVVIATFGTPAQAYVLTNTAAPGTDASWTSLGGAVSFASAAEIHAATDTTKAINSAVLRGETTLTSAGAADKDKLIRLDATGKLDATLLPVSSATIKGSVDVTATITGGPYVNGDILFATADGTIHATWTGVGGQAVKAGDTIVFDGTNWHHVPNFTDLNAYLALAGGTMADGAKVTFDITTGGAGTVIIDGAGGSIDECVIDAGQF